MAKLAARIILAAVIILVLLMTYYTLYGQDDQVYDLEKWRREDERHKLPIYQRYNVHQKPRPVLETRISRPPVQKIKVAYPVEEVPGLQEVRLEVKHPPNSQEVAQQQDNQDELPVNVSSLHSSNDSVPENMKAHINSQGIFEMPLVRGENIVSMTLYGSSGRYTMGALRNAELIKTNFPGWKLRIYTETPSTSRYGVIPKGVMEGLRALGADFYFMQPGEDFIPPMMWRFLIADDTWVDRFIVRDADARLTQRDAAAVYAWIQSDRPFTCIRDHPSHASYALSGGMWGAKPRELRNILRRSWRDLMRGVPSHYLEDMNFLDKYIWPKVQGHAYCLDSVSCDHWPGSFPFPIPRYGYEHVGQVVNEHDLGRPIDLQILRHAGENKNCTPTAKDMYVKS